jgi:hypothetical protein
MDLARLNAVIGYDKLSNLSLEEKIQRAVRAAKFDEQHEGTAWLKLLPMIPEGVSTMRANEMFSLARGMVLHQERMRGLPEAEAQRATAQRLLASNVY